MVVEVDATGACWRCGAGELVPVALPVPVPEAGDDFLDMFGSSLRSIMNVKIKEFEEMTGEY